MIAVDSNKGAALDIPSEYGSQESVTASGAGSRPALSQILFEVLNQTRNSQGQVGNLPHFSRGSIPEGADSRTTVDLLLPVLQPDRCLRLPIREAGRKPASARLRSTTAGRPRHPVRKTALVPVA